MIADTLGALPRSPVRLEVSPMFRIALFAAALAVAALPSLSAAQWGGWSSALVSAPSFVYQVPAQYEWRQHAERPYEFALMLNGRQVGGYCHQRKGYMALVGSRWVNAVCPVEAPAAPPCECAAGGPCICGAGCNCVPAVGQRGDVPTGVDWSKIGPTEEVRIGHRRLSMEELGREIGQQFVDDSKRPHLTVIARDKATRDRLDAELRGPLASLAGAYRVQVYDPAAKPCQAILAPFALDSDERYKTSGVAIYCQAPADEHGQARPDVLYEADKLGDWLRKRHPDFDPNKLTPPKVVNPLSAIDDVARKAVIVGVVIFGALLLLVTMQKKE